MRSLQPIRRHFGLLPEAGPGSAAADADGESGVVDADSAESETKMES